MAPLRRLSTTSTGPPGASRRPGAALDPSRVRLWTSRLIASGERAQVVSPITGEPIATVRRSVAADVDEAFARARLAAPKWAATPIEHRAAVLLRLHDLMLDHRDELIDLLVSACGKTRRDAFEELADVGQVTRY
jgi:acyl-CoA reductase-like NAD-dependent aldehyde dehydrogenase